MSCFGGRPVGRPVVKSSGFRAPPGLACPFGLRLAHEVGGEVRQDPVHAESQEPSALPRAVERPAEQPTRRGVLRVAHPSCEFLEVAPDGPGVQRPAAQGEPRATDARVRADPPRDRRGGAPPRGLRRTSAPRTSPNRGGFGEGAAWPRCTRAAAVRHVGPAFPGVPDPQGSPAASGRKRRSPRPTRQPVAPGGAGGAPRSAASAASDGRRPLLLDLADDELRRPQDRRACPPTEIKAAAQCATRGARRV